ncbi:MAG: hypothetical protein EOM20_01135 [Spartobacteria bacterium]|nr:hypothetical protein [Spartobacteria bacterium]
MKVRLFAGFVLLMSFQVFAQTTNEAGKLLLGEGGEVGYTIYTTKPTQEIQLNGLFLYPNQDEFWGNATAIESQWRFWADYLGISFMIGLSRWEVDVNGPSDLIDPDEVRDVMLIELNKDIDALNAQAEAAAAAASETSETPVTPSLIPTMTDVTITRFSIDGDAYYLPMGISILFKPTMYSLPFEVAVEAGVRYYFVLQDDVTVEAAYTDPAGNYPGTTRKSVNMREGAVALLAVDMGYALSDSIDVFLGAGYQYDILKGTAS